MKTSSGELPMRRALKLLSTFVLAAALLAGPAALGAAFAQTPTKTGQNPSGENPTADSVNEDYLFKQDSKIHGRVSIPDQRAANLIQPQGREYRAFREEWLPWIGGLVILGMIALLGIFLLIKGSMKSPRSAEKIQRYNAFERFNHWMTATCFIVLALSGLNYVFGKRLLMPLIGPDAFGAASQLAKYAHVYLAWPFMLGVLIMLFVWARDNIPNRVDWAWFKAGGGVLGRHAHAERFNAGQKVIFWMVVGFGVAMGATGIAMLFPFTVVGVNGQQVMQVVHATIGVVFISGIILHIYTGTVGIEGSYSAMGSGKVDLAWAREHHDLWVEEQQARTASGPQLKGHAQPAE
jgi:formate dehydrogenase subunit gamma